MLIGDEGFYRADATGVRPMAGGAGAVLRTHTPYAVRTLGNGEFVVSTLNGPLLRFSAGGELRERIHAGDYTALALGTDREGGLWTATEAELLRFSIPSPWSSIGVSQGLQGTVADFEWHDDALWLATSRGLARMRGGKDGRIEPEALPWVDLEGFALAGTKNGLLIAHQEGLLVLDPGATMPRTLLASETESVLELLPSRFQPDLAYALGTTSLMVLRARDGRGTGAGSLPAACRWVARGRRGWWKSPQASSGSATRAADRSAGRLASREPIARPSIRSTEPAASLQWKAQAPICSSWTADCMR